MTQEKILQSLDRKNKEIIKITSKIQKEVKHLPDVHSIGRLSNYINNLNLLNIEIELLKKIII